VDNEGPVDILEKIKDTNVKQNDNNVKQNDNNEKLIEK
jgi:hypothetical protein